MQTDFRQRSRPLVEALGEVVLAGRTRSFPRHPPGRVFQTHLWQLRAQMALDRVFLGSGAMVLFP